jgi:hypothetical protein
MRDAGINSITGDVVVNVTRRVMSNLYMTTEEFAALVVSVLDEQNYFKRGSKNHPYDIAISFATVGESIGTAMSWAISKEHEAKKAAVMMPTNLKKSMPVEPALMYPGETVINDDQVGYFESKSQGYL